MKPINIEAVLAGLIHDLKIPVTKTSIKAELEKHPDQGTMFVIFDMLNYWRVPTGAYHVTFAELIDAKLPLPFVADFHSELALVHYIDESVVIVSNEHWNNHRLDIADFKKRFSGKIIIAEKDDDSGEADYSVKLRKDFIDRYRIPFVISAAVILLFIFLFAQSSYFEFFNLQTALLTVFKTIGLATSIMLLIQSIDDNNPLVQKLCGSDDGKNCNAILSSKAAKITDELSWSEVGFFYFTGTWLVLMFNSANVSLMQTLAMISALCLPYSFYSIRYQWRVVKQWCLFCCTIQALFWLEFFAFLPYLFKPIEAPGLKELSTLAIAFGIPILAWIFIKPSMLRAQQIAPLRNQLLRFKYDSGLFNNLLGAEPEYTMPGEEHSIILGNPAAEQMITMVSNPYCQPCSAAHKKLDDWLTDRNDIKLQVIFTANGDINDRGTKIAAHLMGLKASHDDALLKQGLNDWYGQKQKNYEDWAKKYPFLEAEIDTNVFQIQKDWCREAKITATPTLFINGRRLPRNYQPEDLRYFM